MSKITLMKKSIAAIAIECLKNIIIIMRRIVRSSILVIFWIDTKEYFSNGFKTWKVPICYHTQQEEMFLCICPELQDGFKSFVGRFDPPPFVLKILPPYPDRGPDQLHKSLQLLYNQRFSPLLWSIYIKKTVILILNNLKRRAYNDTTGYNKVIAGMRRRNQDGGFFHWRRFGLCSQPIVL